MSIYIIDIYLSQGRKQLPKSFTTLECDFWTPTMSFAWNTSGLVGVDSWPRKSLGYYIYYTLYIIDPSYPKPIKTMIDTTWMSGNSPHWSLLLLYHPFCAWRLAKVRWQMRPKHHVAKLDFSLASVLISTCGVCTTNTLPSHLGFFYLLTCCFSDKLKCWGPTCSDVCIQGSCTFVQRCITVEHLGKDSSLYVWILGTGFCDVLCLSFTWSCGSNLGWAKEPTAECTTHL